MDKTSFENWVRVKEALEESGNTDNFYYRRACAIVSGAPDPMEIYLMSHRMDEIKPAHYVTREECQEMIDDAIRKHNRNAGIISMFVGFFILGLFSEGLLRLIGVIPPVVPWLHPHL